jgi:hypothetical protein
MAREGVAASAGLDDGDRRARGEIIGGGARGAEVGCEPALSTRHFQGPPERRRAARPSRSFWTASRTVGPVREKIDAKSSIERAGPIASDRCSLFLGA